MTEPKIEIRPLTDAVPDDLNANQHTQAGHRIVETSLRERGFFRPIAAAGKGVRKPVVKAGNLTQESAINAGMEEAIFIYTDGTRPIVHVRTDLAPDSPEAARLAVEDNRASQVSLNWDPSVLARLEDEHPGTVDGLWGENEWAALLSGAASTTFSQTLAEGGAGREHESPEDFPEYDTDVHTDYTCPRCSYSWSGAPK